MFRSKEFYKIRGESNYWNFLAEHGLMMSLVTAMEVLENLHPNIDVLDSYNYRSRGKLRDIRNVGRTTRVKQRFFITVDLFVPYK